MESDKEEDEDIDAPSIDDLTFFADLLRKGTPRKRLKGPVGDALRELSKIEARIAEGNLSAEERAHLHFRLWGLNGRADDKSPRPLGRERFFRPENRPKGAPSRYVNSALDSELLAEAKSLIATYGTIGAALRNVVKRTVAQRPEAFGARVAEESHVKRLLRKAKRQHIFES